MDSHAHLQHARFDSDRDDVIARTFEAGVERIIVPGWDLASSEAALELAARHGPAIQPGVGVHPHHAADMDEPGWARLEALAADPGARALGEIGLDHFRKLSTPEVQLEVFERQLDLAARRALPVLVHDREAHAQVTTTLVEWSGHIGDRSGGHGVLHAFSGDAAMAGRLVAAGFVVSFALPVAFRSAVGPRAAAGLLAEGSFLVETDAPYLGPDRDRRNEPTTVLRVVAELARIRATTPDALVTPIRKAYERLFALSPGARSLD